MDSTESTDKFEGWVILELMGHRRLAGFISEQEIAGRAFLRIDVPAEPPATQFYGAEAVYCITPATEETARNAARLSRIAPVQRWELPAPPREDRNRERDGEEGADHDLGDDYAHGADPF